MNRSRRFFLGRTLATGGLISFGGSVPRLLAAASSAQPAPSGRRLVVIFLEGGNDGLNTVIPVRDPLYQKYRPETKIDPAASIPLNDELSLHPAMRGVADVWDAGRLAILQGVGYPGHSRSHFVSQAVWHAADVDAEAGTSDGWLGRALDQRQTHAEAPLAYSVGFAETPTSLRGRTTRTAVPPSVGRDEAERIQKLLARHSNHPLHVQKKREVARVQQDAVDALDHLVSSDSPAPDRFPDSQLGRQLAQVAWLIRSGNPACAYYLRQSGYDTHAGQPPRHATLLRELAEALREFDNAMTNGNLSSLVTVMVFSEFGRRVAENKSGGTDHGAAGPVFLLGGGYVAGLHGDRSDLENLQNGDLRVTMDFRSVYATLLRHSLDVAPEARLTTDFPPLAGLRCQDNC